MALPLSVVWHLHNVSDFLDTSSPSNIDDEFVSSSPTETLKILSRG